MKKDPYAPIRETLAEPPMHWRSLEHREGDPSVTDTMDVEFPNGAAPSDYSRRDALKLAGAGLAMGSLVGCIRRPEEEILPFVRHPEKVIPGVRMMYATAMHRATGAVGLLVEAHEGRPTKIEGNPNHPSSLGASDVWAQAEVLKLYDPDRARTPLKEGKPSTWTEWEGFSKEHFGKLQAEQGKGLAFLVPEDGGPTFERLLAAAQVKLPQAKVYRWDPLTPDNTLLGAELAFGAGARVSYDLEKAKVLFSLDANFLGEGPQHLSLARQFGKSRAVMGKEDAVAMNRLYVAEGIFSTTGANADHRLRASSGELPELLKGLAHELGQLGLSASLTGVSGKLPAGSEKFVKALAKDLLKNKGASVVLVGERQPAVVHQLAHALNVALGALEAGLMQVAKVEGATPRVSQFAQLTALTQSLNAGEVQTVVMFETNPLYTAPGSLKFGDALAKATAAIHVGVLPEETGIKVNWHLPGAHFLECWGDARAWDGTVSLVQPLILPIFNSRAATSLLAQMIGHGELVDRKLVEETWRAEGGTLAGLLPWRKALHDGLVADSAWPTLSAVELPGADSLVDATLQGLGSASGTSPSKDALEFVAYHGYLQDGRLANVSWLQELPDSMSKLCWDNAVLVSPALAKELGIESAVYKNSYQADVVELEAGGRKLTAPAFVLPGLATFTLGMVKGFGKTAGEVCKGMGVDASPLLADATGVVQGVKLTRTGRTQELCSTQDHFSVPGNPFKELTFAQMVSAQGVERELGLGKRPLYRTGTAAAVASGTAFARQGDLPKNLVEKAGGANPTKGIQLTNEITYEGQQWGMAIDLSACIGCNACVAACVAENNIPAVGREQVLLGRELHWMRVDRYFQGDVEDPQAAHQPVNCLQCENAPCEPVCPVAATTHDEEGLNSMAYNRCIGTRYCANNCPVKVRRFNYLDFTDSGNLYVDPVKKERMKSLQLQRNPDVTVRYRGVMEKCTYCTQRIEEAKIAAKREGNDRKALPDGAVVSACQQACPTQAISFGNINDPNSRVARAKQSDRNYEMLQELNIRPRTSYLARVRNVNEELG